MQNSSGSNNFSWLNLVETLSVAGSLGGTVASLISQQVIFATIPLSLSATLNLVNRRRLLNQVAQENQTAIAESVRYTQASQEFMTELVEQKSKEQQTAITELVRHTQASQESMTELVEQKSKEQQAAIAELVKQTKGNQSHLQTLFEQLQETQQVTSDLSRSTETLHDFTQNLNYQQNQLEDIVGELREIENFSQALRTNPDCAQFYYQRGLSHQRLGDKQGAIEDYNKAIRLNSGYAKAYHNRGILNAEAGDRKVAVEDLRQAAKFYFEQGDIDSYQKAKDMSKEIHDLNSHAKDRTPESLLLSSFLN